MKNLWLSSSESEQLTKKEREKDKRLRKTYGITLGDYNRILELQGGVCAICGRAPKDKPLNVDHFHFKIEAKYLPLVRMWVAKTTIDDREFKKMAPTKAAAIEAVRLEATPYSVRGLLCPGRYRGCNRLLGRVDDVKWLGGALSYLKDPPARRYRQEVTQKVLAKFE